VEAMAETVGDSPAGDRSDADLRRTSIERACDQIRAAALREDEYAGMGTTVVAARVADGRLSVAYVGDSRLYLLSHGQLRQVTQDDTWIASMLAAHPAAHRTALEHHPLCHRLTDAVGGMAQATVH